MDSCNTCQYYNEDNIIIIHNPRSVTEFSPGKVLYQHVSIYLHAGMFVCLFVYLFICLSVPFIIIFLRQIMSFTSVVRAHNISLTASPTSIIYTYKNPTWLIC